MSRKVVESFLDLSFTYDVYRGSYVLTIDHTNRAFGGRGHLNLTASKALTIVQVDD